MTDSEIKFTACDWEEIQPLVSENIMTNSITVESYWEDNILECCHYKMMYQDKIAGYFAIRKGSEIWLFNVFPPYASKAQELFSKVKKYENVTSAMVTTGDEFFMSHCLDNFVRIEKQAFFSIYTEKELPAERQKEIGLRLADIDRDLDVLKLSGDWLDDIVKQIKGGVCHIEIHIAEAAGEVVGFGIIDYGRIIKDIASIGMYVCEQCRTQGYAVNILRKLKQLAQDKGYRVFSGCWYYNHNSQKSIESAGGYSKTRLIRFCF